MVRTNSFSLSPLVIAKKKNEYAEKNPDKKVISLGTCRGVVECIRGV